jgi:hypothetical protein
MRAALHRSLLTLARPPRPAARVPARLRPRHSAAAAPSPLGTSDSDDDRTVARVPLAKPRRSRRVSFTCNVCDARTEKKVNPVAWDRGAVFLQCDGCGAWHKLADAAGLIDEIRFAENSAAALALREGGAELAFDASDDIALAPRTPDREEEGEEGGGRGGGTEGV